MPSERGIVTITFSWPATPNAALDSQITETHVCYLLLCSFRKFFVDSCVVQNGVSAAAWGVGKFWKFHRGGGVNFRGRFYRVQQGRGSYNKTLPMRVVWIFSTTTYNGSTDFLKINYCWLTNFPTFFCGGAENISYCMCVYMNSFQSSITWVSIKLFYYCIALTHPSGWETSWAP